jgi:hypothetical protein
MIRRLPSGIILLISFLILFYGKSFAQVEGISIVSAENYFLDRDYRNALIGFEEYLLNVQFTKDVAYKAGICATRLGIGQKGIQHIISARSAGKSDNYLNFWLGRSYHLDEQWDSATVYLEKYLDVFPVDKAFKKEAQLYLNQIELAKSMIPSSLQPFVVEDMGSGINSVYSEFHPMLTNDGKTITFCSRKKGYMEEKILDDGEYKEKIFSSKKLPDGTWSKAIPIRLVEGRNKDLDYNAIQLIDNNSKLLMYKVQNNLPKLYISEYVNENWKLPYVSPIEPDPRFFSGDIVFTDDLKKVIFTTNGNTNTFQNDLYSSQYDEKTKTWSEPLFLGKTVNSGKDEAAPFLLDQNTMIFSSKTENGIGDFDLFKSTWDAEKKTWGTPVNMGFPYNTPKNDFYFFMQAERPDVHYFSSVRGSTRGQTDIYKVTKTAIVDGNGIIKEETGKPIGSTVFNFDDPENFQNLTFTTDSEGRFAGKMVAGQTYLVSYKKENKVFEGTLSISFPANAAQLTNLEVQLAPKVVKKVELEESPSGSD